jgi:hypothetical protein
MTLRDFLTCLKPDISIVVCCRNHKYMGMPKDLPYVIHSDYLDRVVVEVKPYEDILTIVM